MNGEIDGGGPRGAAAGASPAAGAGPAASGGNGAAPAEGSRLRQTAAVFRLELRKLLLAPGTVALALLAALPPGLFAAAWIGRALFHKEGAVADVNGEFATTFMAFGVSIVLFFGCVVVFTNLVRRELRDRTLHHYLLAPIRRELVLAAKYAAGVVATFALFGGGTLAAFVFAYGPCFATDRPALERFFLGGPGLAHLAAYLGIALLACLGYGAVFLAFGLWFRGPILPALIVFGWEILNGFLPPALKKLSVYYYLNGLTPVPVAAGPFALLAQPPSPWLAVPGLLALAAVLLVVSARRFRRIEVLYAED